MRRNKIAVALSLFIILVICFSFSANFAFASGKKVGIGGEIIGFNLPYDGVEVVGFQNVDTIYGAKNAEGSLEIGDLIVRIDGNQMSKLHEVALYLDKIQDEKPINITVVRKGVEVIVNFVPLIDKNSGVKKLGISAKDSIAGLGTVTFIDKNGNFGALGHSVTDSKTGKTITDKDGLVYNCTVSGISKGEKGTAGAINGYLTSEIIGKVDDCKSTGIYGSTCLNGSDEYELGSRQEVKIGKACICSCISGKKEFYDIEIIRATYQKSTCDKGIIIKVTDKRLLSLTGGIVQGMSGSPIVQNGKIIGAVTHVFVNDPTRGYGIYIDWMCN